MHGVGEGAVRQRVRQRHGDRLRRGLGHPEIGGERHPVREYGGEHAVRDAQAVPLDQPLDREGDRQDQYRDGREQARELDEHVGRLAGAVVDVLGETRCGAVREGGDGEDQRDGQQSDEQTQQIGGAVHTGGEQWFVAGDPVDGCRLSAVGSCTGPGSCAGLRSGPGRCFPTGLPTGSRFRTGIRPRTGSAGGRSRGGCVCRFRHARPLRRVLMVSYHCAPPRGAGPAGRARPTVRPPPGRWWHVRAAQAGIRAPLPKAGRSVGGPEQCRCGGSFRSCRRAGAVWTG